MRTFRLMLLAAAAVTMVSAASLAVACDSAKASAEKASATSCSSKAEKATAANASATPVSAAGCTAEQAAASASKASAGCTAEQAAACAAKAAAGGCSAEQAAKCASKAGFASYTIKGYMPELSDTEQTVNVTVTETEKGVVMAFAGANPEVARAVAVKAQTMLSKSSACNESRASMAKAGDFTHCAQSVQAFAGAQVTVEDTETGAVTTIVASEEVPVTQLHAVFRNLQDTPVEETVKG